MKPPKTDQKPMSLICSYSHKDEALRDELETHLSLLKRRGILHTWHDRKIGAGLEWEGEIDKNLEAANVILLLVSADFLESDYCFDKEMRRALEKHEAGEARVIPVILRPVDLSKAPFGHLQALPKDAKPVTMWSNRDEAWTDVAKGIRKTIEETQRTGTQLTLPFPSDTPDHTAKASPALAILQACPDGVPLVLLCQS